MADEKRFAFIPLDLENGSRALGGEIVADDTTGDIWIRNRATGELVSSTSNLEKKIRDILSGGMESNSFAFNNNRKVYRFYFENEIVRLDRMLGMPSEFVYYRIRDVRDDSKYYVNELTNVSVEATSLFPFSDNDVYFVEFYNVRRELMSQIMFTGKYAPTVLSGGEPEKIINRIEIHTNKDILYVTENPTSLLIRVYAVYEDGSSRDITNFDNLLIDAPIATDAAGTASIKATYYYDTVHGQYVEDEKEIAIVEDVYAQLVDFVVSPAKIIRLNDGTRSIKLNIVGYFEDGSVRDVSDEVVVSNNFDPQLFNVEQYLTIKFNAGHLNVVQKDYTLLVKDDGSASENVLFFRDGLMSIAEDFVPAAGSMFFKVRDPEDLNFFYTLSFNEIGYDAAYMEKSNILDKMKTGNNVLVEFYGEDKKLIDSTVFTAKYKEDEPLPL
jgi:hypothetical protein